MTTSAKPVNTTVVLWWDIDSVYGALSDVRDFFPYLKHGIKHRFNLGDASRYRVSVFHQHSLHKYPEVHAALPNYFDVLDTGSQTPTQVMGRKCLELMEDWKPNEVILWVVSSEAQVIEHIRRVREKGFNVFLVADFERLNKSINNLHWLEIYSYYVIAHGDLRKLMGHKIPRQIQDRTLGFASPIVLSALKLRLTSPTPTSSPPPVLRFSRVIAPPSSPSELYDHFDCPEEQEWSEATRLQDAIYYSST